MEFGSVETIEIQDVCDIDVDDDDDVKITEIYKYFDAYKRYDIARFFKITVAEFDSYNLLVQVALRDKLEFLIDFSKEIDL